MASVNITSQNWNGSTYNIRFDFSWNVTTENSNFKIYEYHGKASVLELNIPSGNVVWNNVTSNFADIAGFSPYMKYIATFADQTIIFSAKEHPSHVADSYYPSYYPTMQTQMYRYNFTNFDYIGETGCCVPSTLVAVREKIEHDIRPNSTRKYSPSWIYGAIQKSGDDNTGIYTNEALDFLVSTGVPSYRKIRNNANVKKEYPDVYIKQSKTVTYYGYTETLVGAVQRYNAVQNSGYSAYGRINSWKRVSLTDVVDIMNYVKGYAKSACLDIVVTEEFDNACKNLTTQKGVVPRLNQYSATRGAHSMIILGWKKINDEYHWICQNSWGRTHPFDTGNWWDTSTWKEVGDNGLIYVPFSYHARIQNGVLNGGIYNVYLIDGGDYGSDEFKWDTPKVKGKPFNITASEWTRLQNYINECLGYVNKSPYSFKTVSPNDPFTWGHYNDVRLSITNTSSLGSAISIPFVLSGYPIKADENINKIVESLNSVT